MTINDIPQKVINETITALGGSEIEVILNGGARETVNVRQLAVREYQQAIGIMDDPQALMALVCSRSIEWVNSLTPESYDHVDTEVEKVNELFFRAAARTIERRAASLPRDLVQAMMGDLNQSASPKSSMPSRR